jgi:hypothetical protein
MTTTDNRKLQLALLSLVAFSYLYTSFTKNIFGDVHQQQQQHHHHSENVDSAIILDSDDNKIITVQAPSSPTQTPTSWKSKISHLSPIPYELQTILDEITTPVQKIPNSNNKDPKYAGQLFQSPFNLTLQRMINTTFTLQSFGGWPLCIVTNMCIREHSRVVYSRYYFGSHPKIIEKDIDSINTTAKGRSCHPDAGQHSRNLKPLYDPIDTILKESSKSNIDNIIWLRGTTFVANTWAVASQLDHVGSKALQFFSLWNLALNRNHWKIDDFASRFFYYMQSRFPSKRRPETQFTTHIVRLGLGPYYNVNRSLYHDEFNNDPNRIICMERSIELSGIYERKFLGVENLKDFQQAAGEWAPSINSNYKPKACPSHKIFVLHRSEGSGNRIITNFHELELAFLFLFGTLEYSNVTISSHSTHAQQVELFADFALMISPHSSQLFNVVFSHPLSAVLEYRPCCEPKNYETDPLGYELWERLPSPFCPGYDCGITYGVTHHQGLKPNTYKCDVILNRPVFEKDLKQLLLKQLKQFKTSKCEMPNYLLNFIRLHGSG